MAKTDFIGGAFIFLLMFSIAMVQLYILKNVKAFKSKKDDDDDDDEDDDVKRFELECKASNGKWKSDDSSPLGGCCSGVTDFDPLLICEASDTAKLRGLCPSGCLHDPNSSFCMNNPECVFEV